MAIRLTSREVPTSVIPPVAVPPWTRRAEALTNAAYGAFEGAVQTYSDENPNQHWTVAAAAVGASASAAIGFVPLTEGIFNASTCMDAIGLGILSLILPVVYSGLRGAMIAGKIPPDPSDISRRYESVNNAINGCGDQFEETRRRG